MTKFMVCMRVTVFMVKLVAVLPFHFQQECKLIENATMWTVILDIVLQRFFRNIAAA